MNDGVGETETGAVTPDRIDDVRSFYRSGQEITVRTLPPGTAKVVAESSTGVVVEGVLERPARLVDLLSGTHAVQARDADGRILAEEFTTVGAHAGERPVHGFATSFTDDDVDALLAWHRGLRSTVVQVYDWMASYTEPLGAGGEWRDPSNRPVSLSALRAMSQGLADLGAVSHAYAPIYAVGNEFAVAHPEMLLYHADGRPIRFLDQIVLADPGNQSWQRHFADAYGAAADSVGFTGYHVDTYGYPRIAFTASGASVDMRAAYEGFLGYLRAERPEDLISFNQVDGVPSAARLPGGPIFRYCEVWPPNDRWRHFEGLLDRSSGRAGRPLGSGVPREAVRGSIACYPPVWGIGDPSVPIPDAARGEALRTALCTEAIVTMLGASALIFGDRAAALCDPYYPKHARLTTREAREVLEWRRFGLRCRDLFIDGEDTSWYEIGDENGSVSVTADAPVRPEPVGGALFARVSHVEDCIAVGLVDLTGSTDGSWSEPTARGRVTSAMVQVLVDRPERWRAESSAVGVGDGRFHPLAVRDVTHRQGRALEVDVPIGEGWAVLRVRPRGAADG